MRLVGRPKLADFAKAHSDARSAIEAWALEASEGTWSTPADIKARFPSASILSGNRVVFNLKGNNYRLEVKVSYELNTVLVLRLGTHSGYSKWKL